MSRLASSAFLWQDAPHLLPIHNPVNGIIADCRAHKHTNNKRRIWISRYIVLRVFIHTGHLAYFTRKICMSIAFHNMYMCICCLSCRRIYSYPLMMIVKLINVVNFVFQFFHIQICCYRFNGLMNFMSASVSYLQLP